MFHMSQNNYKLKIVEILLKNKNHIRGLAKDIGTNQMTISRKINELYKENIVDYHEEGKNKVFSLKKTLEAKQYVCIVELHKLFALIKKYPKLRLIIEKIRENNKISLALLFGSYAKGSATLNSDIDVYIETQNSALKKEIELIDTRLSVKIGKYAPQNILIKEIQKNHVIIKGVEEYYEKNQFFT